MNKEKWQKPHIHSVLDYHNNSYGTAYELAGRCEQFFPKLEGGWDWVCCDHNTGSKGAIEVKRLTDEQKHEIETVLKRISDKLEKQLSGRIPGLYHLLLTIWDRPLDLDGDNREKSEKIKKLEKILLKTVEDSASSIEAKEIVDLSGKIRAYLPHIVSTDFEASLQRITGGQSCLVIEMQTGGDAPSIALRGNQFTKFKTLVQKANEQLGKAKVRGISGTFFIWLDLLYHLPAPPDAIRNTLRQLNSEDHCNIDYVYHVANSVTHIKP